MASLPISDLLDNKLTATVPKVFGVNKREEQCYVKIRIILQNFPDFFLVVVCLFQLSVFRVFGNKKFIKYKEI